MSSDAEHEQALQNEVARLEEELSIARSKLKHNSDASVKETNTDSSSQSSGSEHGSLASHALLLLSDSALPLGSFAFSSGLESYLAHHTPTTSPSKPPSPNTLPSFVSTSLQSLASTTLPYILAVHRSPVHLAALDDELDACILCPVGKRASIAQGRALLTLWQRALKHGCPASDASRALQAFSVQGLASGATPHSYGSGGSKHEESPVHAHFPLIWAVVCAAMHLSDRQTAYTFLFNHAKAVMSAGVRAGVMGPYAVQQLLGSQWLRAEIEAGMEGNWNVLVEDAGQSVPMMDLWIGRHELLYSRIFNS